MIRNLIFGGIKHCGKTTLGSLTAETLGLPWVDTDKELERRFQKSVRELYRERGETAFRKLEADEVRKQVMCENQQVVSIGGGAVENPFLDWGELKQYALFLFLDIPLERAFERIKRRGLPPFLEKEADPFLAFRTQAEKRRLRFQEIADITCRLTEERTARENADELVRQLKEYFNHER